MQTGVKMYQVIANQLKLREKQREKLKKDLETKSWLYSDNKLKQSFACFVYALPFNAVLIAAAVTLYSVF